MNAEVPDSGSTVRWVTLISKCEEIVSECERNEKEATDIIMENWMRGYAAGARRLLCEVSKSSDGRPPDAAGDVHV